MRILKPYITRSNSFILDCSSLNFDYFTISAVSSKKGLKLYDYIDKKEDYYISFINFDYFLTETYKILYNGNILKISSEESKKDKYFGSTQDIRIIFYKDEKMIDLSPEFLKENIHN